MVKLINILLLLFITAFCQAETLCIKNDPDDNYAYLENGSNSESVYIDESSPSLNFDTWPKRTSIDIENYYGDSYVTDNAGLIKFNLSSINLPEDSYVVSAWVRLYYKWTEGGPVQSSNLSIFKCLKAWDVHTVTWNEFASGQQWEIPGARGVTDRGEAISSNIFIWNSEAPTPYGWIEWEVTDAVVSWINGEDNYGFILDFYPEWGNKRGFAGSISKQPYGQTEWRPELVINYAVLPTNQAVIRNNSSFGEVSAGALSEDIELNSTMIDDNQSSIAIGSDITGTRKALLRFDVGSTLENTSDFVINAKLRLFVNSTDNTETAIGVYGCLKPWEINSVNWYDFSYGNAWAKDGAESVLDKMYLDEIPVSNSDMNNWVEFDVTKIVTEWFAGKKNNGFILEASEMSEGQVLFASSMYSDISKRPQLLIEFLSNYESSCPTRNISDINRDCVIDLKDFMILSMEWNSL